jgi:peptide/nickel transport system substrate-binding protein
MRPPRQAPQGLRKRTGPRAPVPSTTAFRGDNMMSKGFGWKRWIMGSILLLGVVSFAFPQALSAKEKELRISASVFPETLDTGGFSAATFSLVFQMYDQLVHRTNDMKVTPGLATSWEVLSDSHWRFHLRKGVKFHDGSDFTAEDVKFSLDYVLHPDKPHGVTNRIAPIQEVKVVDRYTVDIYTKGVFATMLLGLSNASIEPKEFVKKNGRDALLRQAIGTGPFKLAVWEPGDRLEIVANKNYWGGAPKVDRVVVRQVPEATTRIASLLAGEADIIEEVPVDLIPQVESSSNAVIDSVPSNVGLILTMDTSKKPFDNPKVREAMQYAINKELILKQILRGNGELLDGQLLSRNAFGHNPNLKPFPYDPAKAKALLKEAGLANGFTTSITTRSGKYLSDVDMTNAIVGMLSEVGIKATVNVVEGGVYSKMTKAHDMGPIHLVGWYNLGEADYAMVWFTKKSNRAYWYNQEYEDLFIKGRSTLDTAKREKAYWRMAEIMREVNPSVFLFDIPTIYARSKKLTGWAPPSDKVLRLITADVAQ